MNVGPRCGVVLIASSLACGAILGCHRGEPEAQQTETQALPMESYELLKPKVAELQKTLADVHQGTDEIAAEIPGGQEFRAKLLATEEVLGVADARTKWLGGELEAARTSPKKQEEIAGLADQVTKTAADLAQVNTAALELMHEKARLQRVGALLKAPYEQVLSTGYRVKAATSGVEARLIAFIQDPKKKIDKTTWFDFDRLVFFTESEDIDFPKSRSQLENVVQILKAYPAVKLKIGAYTDAGPAARNKKLSTDRAQTVRTALIQMGVTPTRLEDEGFGSEHPVCPANDSEFCRAQNRRTALHVAAK
jgi:outer membrane protein OmpA-like peptidoglycan-associated protein